MKLIKPIVPAAMIAVFALFASHVCAQTMGEYATTVGVASGGGSMGTSVSPSIGSSDIGGGSSTWGASGLGGSFDERAGAASGFGGATDFESRAAASGIALDTGSRWPGTGLSSAASSRFGSSDRFAASDRFSTGDRWQSGDRFAGSAFNDNGNGLDTSFNTNELDFSHSSGGIDNSYVTSGVEASPGNNGIPNESPINPY